MSGSARRHPDGCFHLDETVSRPACQERAGVEQVGAGQDSSRCSLDLVIGAVGHPWVGVRRLVCKWAAGRSAGFQRSSQAGR